MDILTKGERELEHGHSNERRLRMRNKLEQDIWSEIREKIFHVRIYDVTSMPNGLDVTLEFLDSEFIGDITVNLATIEK